MIWKATELLGKVDRGPHGAWASIPGAQSVLTCDVVRTTRASKLASHVSACELALAQTAQHEAKWKKTF